MPNEIEASRQPMLHGVSGLKGQCAKVLNRLVLDYPSLEFVSLSLVDGRAFVHEDGLRISDPNRVAAVTTSLFGLSESVAKEALTSTCKYSVIAAEGGTVVTVRVPSRRRLFALSVCASQSENLATVLRKALDTAATLAETVDLAVQDS